MQVGPHFLLSKLAVTLVQSYSDAPLLGLSSMSLDPRPYPRCTAVSVTADMALAYTKVINVFSTNIVMKSYCNFVHLIAYTKVISMFGTENNHDFTKNLANSVEG
eukprot:74978-Rhodomonas_salina.1